MVTEPTETQEDEKDCNCDEGDPWYGSDGSIWGATGPYDDPLAPAPPIQEDIFLDELVNEPSADERVFDETGSPDAYGVNKAQRNPETDREI